ncbi:MAG: putative toxin-antitoxin system toxin component, PIN family [bacterium]
MRIVLDTNVFISGVFFTGPPFQILKAWHDDKLAIVISPEIFDEYYRVGKELSNQFPLIDLNPILELLTIKAEFIYVNNLSEPICDDPDDDKFIACAISSRSNLIVSGDKHLLKVSGYQGIEIIKPQVFVNRYI